MTVFNDTQQSFAIIFTDLILIRPYHEMRAFRVWTDDKQGTQSSANGARTFVECKPIKFRLAKKIYQVLMLSISWQLQMSTVLVVKKH